MADDEDVREDEGLAAVDTSAEEPDAAVGEKAPLRRLVAEDDDRGEEREEVAEGAAEADMGRGCAEVEPEEADEDEGRCCEEVLVLPEVLAGRGRGVVIEDESDEGVAGDTGRWDMRSVATAAEEMMRAGRRGDGGAEDAADGGSGATSEDLREEASSEAEASGLKERISGPVVTGEDVELSLLGRIGESEAPRDVGRAEELDSATALLREGEVGAALDCSCCEEE